MKVSVIKITTENYKQLDSLVADFRVALKGNKGMKGLPDTDA